MRLRSIAPALLTATLVVTGCGAPANPSPRVGGEGKGPQDLTPISDEKFAEAVHQLLISEPRSVEHRSLLAKVVSRQMRRAQSFFEGQSADRGVTALTGAISLANRGELDTATLGTSGKPALAHAARELSSRGDEGAAIATYSMLVRLSPENERKEQEAHLNAIVRWLKDLSASGKPIDRAQLMKNVTVARALLEPSDQTLKEATDRSTEWLAYALEVKSRYSRSKIQRAVPIQSAEREEMFAAVAALKFAPLTIAALHLRHGDAASALAALDKAHANDVAPELYKAVEAAAKSPSAERWRDLLAALRPDEEDSGDANLGPLVPLLRVAQFRVASEIYRLDPTMLEGAAEVASALLDFDMLEAAPLIIGEAVKAHPEPRYVQSALALLMQAMMRAPDGDTARNAFKAGAALLALGDQTKVKINPSSGTVRALMGEIELRDGHVAEARGLLQTAATTERTGPVSATLARIARSEGRPDEALGHLKEALRSAEAARSASLRGEVLLMTSDILREKGQAAQARDALTDALRGLADARKSANAEAEARARVERTLAKVLDRFGAPQKAKQALERAYDAAPRDKQEASATLLTMASRAVLHGDLPGARDGLRRGLAADLPPDDVVYLALWVRLVERQKKAPADSSAERALATIKDDGRWTGRLASFALGKINAAQLAQAARTPAQKTEGLFYAAMEQRIGGDVKGADTTLEKVVQSSGGIELMEVGIARDLLSGARATLTGPVPDVGLP